MKPKWVVNSVTTLDNYKLLVTFECGEQKLYDMKPLLEYPVFSPLTNKALFKSAHTDGCTVVWNDDIDIDPECLYNEGIPVSF